MKNFWLILLLCSFLFTDVVVATKSPISSESLKSPEYVTSSSCQGCHLDEYINWKNSHHGWAWRLPEKENVLGDFNDQNFEHASVNYQFKTEDGEYFIIADNADGELIRYKIHSVVGVTPLQQYLVETENGRLQSLDVVWDTIKKRWYHLYPGEDTSAGNGMHWSGVYKNWNSRCAECHATDYKKNYSPKKDSYASTQSEIGVGCEACHGPGSGHVEWANSPGDFSLDAWHKVDEHGLTTAYIKNDAASEINLCASCHSRREPTGADGPVPGSLFSDNYHLSLLRDGLYFPDGQIHDEVYVYGSFLQSKMYAKGVTCTNCHDAHTYELKAQGNAVCTQCHNQSGNTQFPSLTKKHYDDSSHHFHQQAEGSQCVECHMPERNYMIVDGRRDHSFRIPRPDLTENLGVPNACNQCHSDQTASWALEEIKKRYPEGRLTQNHAFAEVLASTSENQFNPENVKQLILLAGNKALPGIVRASALSRLMPVADSVDISQIDPFLSDDNEWVRAAAANLVAMSSHESKQAKLAPLLKDPFKSVRLRAIKAFINADLNSLKFSVALDVRRVMKEYQQSLADKADFPENQMAIAGLALTMKNIPAAVNGFNKAVNMDPQLVQAWVMLARIHAAVGQLDEMKKTLEKAIAANPDVPELKQMLNDAN